jgi:hypothetical protein
MRHQSAGGRRCRHGSPDGQPRGGYRRRRSGLRKAACGCGASLTVIVIVASLGAYLVYRHLTGNIKAAQADSADTLMTSLKASPAAQNLLAEPAPQTGTSGPVTLVLGSDFAGVKPPPAPPAGQPGHGKPHKARHASSSAGGGYGSATFVQSRNAGSSICSGLPASNPNSGSPP